MDGLPRRSAPIARGRPPTRRTRLPRSTKAIERTELKRTAIIRRETKGRAAWVAARDEHLRECGGRCELGPILAAAGLGPFRSCSGIAVTCHHALPRQMGGSAAQTRVDEQVAAGLEPDLSELKLEEGEQRLYGACQTCHDYVEAHPVEAKALGLKILHR